MYAGNNNTYTACVTQLLCESKSNQATLKKIFWNLKMYAGENNIISFDPICNNFRIPLNI